MTEAKQDETALEALARAYDREDASQRGEPDPWEDGAEDQTWRAERLACAKAAMQEFTPPLTRRMCYDRPGPYVLKDSLHSCVCLLEVMADNAKERGDDVEWAMMSVMAKNGREVLDGYHPE